MHYCGFVEAGFHYSPSVTKVDHAFGIPVAFASFMTRSKDSGTRMESGVKGAYDYIGDRYGEIRGCGTLLSFLFSRGEFIAGITPGYIGGLSNSISGATWMHP